MLAYRIDEEVSLRMFDEGDAEEFYNLTIHSKEHLRKWLGWLDQIESLEDITQYIRTRLKIMAEDGGYLKSFAIIYKGKIAGTIGFNAFNKRNKSGVVGYWIGENFQGKGIMSRALKAVIDYGFKELGLDRIEVCVATENEKSRALPERFGFTEEGILRQAEWLYDHYVDHIVYGLLRQKWK
ncbi:GNAT family N-acetyltransferase [Trichococcus pasteurii]|uniref:Acyl-coa n-acyltransferase n=1 Tax=Trichococcus pasteurii TaxID=43064 RepID=A0A1W1IGY8_9LACT|nr:GNAT family protein [Trichococcus pasteurii]SFE90055.1 ribosomal-protein-serine acetyltransferase [Trichococcus pasteurii]SLM52282.1 acyl-coa n-acyltransferase [Trichococcus pasteurii]SSB93163.1 acyl-coa n-acyltransferase [Trichococcus pasteurii]